MESQKIKEMRRAKFLSKIGSQNKSNKKDNINDNNKNKNLFSPTINQSPQSFIPNNTNISQKENTNKINFNELLSKIEQYDYMIHFQSSFKKILILIISILHCLNYNPLDNYFTIKYTLIILEISSYFFNQYYNNQKKNVTKDINFFDENNIKREKTTFEHISEQILKRFGSFGRLFYIISFLKDVMDDIALVIIVNIVFFIIET